MTDENDDDAIRAASDSLQELYEMGFPEGTPITRGLAHYVVKQQIFAEGPDAMTVTDRKFVMIIGAIMQLEARLAHLEDTMPRRTDDQ